jgi:hypothetical protein
LHWATALACPQTLAGIRTKITIDSMQFGFFGLQSDRGLLRQNFTERLSREKGGEAHG